MGFAIKDYILANLDLFATRGLLTTLAFVAWIHFWARKNYVKYERGFGRDAGFSSKSSARRWGLITLVAFVILAGLGVLYAFNVESYVVYVGSFYAIVAMLLAVMFVASVVGIAMWELEKHVLRPAWYKVKNFFWVYYRMVKYRAPK